MLPSTYKKVIVKQFSRDPYEAMEIVDEKMYPPGPNEILVKNIYVGANFTDVPRMMGLAKEFQTTPFDTGIDALGEVVEVGSLVEEFKVGDIVVTAFFGNGFREYSLIEQRLAAVTTERTPERLGLVISGAMASIMLEVVAGYDETTPKQTVFVTAGLGDTGHYVVQLAKVMGHHVVTTCANEEEARYLYDLGCDRVIVRDKEEVADVMHSEYPMGVNLAIESFGGHFFTIALDSLAPRGQLISSGSLFEHTDGEGNLHAIDVYNKLILRATTIHGFNPVEYAQFIRQHSFKLNEMHKAGTIKTLLDKRQFKGIESVPSAVAHMMTRDTLGKIVIEL